MVNRTFTTDDLTELLERFRLQQASGTSTLEVTQAQLDLLLARIASLTDALRSADDSDAARLASRLLLGDVALVGAHFRGRANEMAESLTRALEGLHAELDTPGSRRP